MKIRNGWVSNSSSSSFIVIGKEILSEEAKKEENLFVKTDMWGGEGVYAIHLSLSSEDIDRLEKNNIPTHYYKVYQYNKDEDNRLKIDLDVMKKAIEDNVDLEIVSGEKDNHWNIDRLIEQRQRWEDTLK